MDTARGHIPDRLLAGMSMREAHDYLQRPSRRRFLAGAATVGAVGPVLWRQSSAFGQEAPPAGVHVAYGGDPTTSMVVSWSTPSAPASPAIEYGLDTTYGTTVAAETKTAPGHGVTYHHASVAGLTPGSEYRYRIVGTDTTGSFTTAPSQAAPFRFVTFGDMGATAAGATISQRVAEAAPDLVFVVGDLCYADRLGGLVEFPPEFGPLPGAQDLSQWDAWLAQIEPTASSVPWMPTVGNHEMEVAQGPLGYDGVFARMALPRTGFDPDSPAYWFRYGSVAFVALDGNDVSAEIRRNNNYTEGAQTAWLRGLLADLRADATVDFIVVGFHNCMYCTNAVHASDGGNRSAWEPLFDEFGVDLVINGHNHSYERTHPLTAGSFTTEAPIGASVSAGSGTIYVTAGAGGQAAYPSTLAPASYVWTEPGVQVPESAEWSVVQYAGDHSLVVVDVEPPSGTSPARLTYRALASDGVTEIDRLTILGRGPASTLVASTPDPTTGATLGAAAAPRTAGSLPATGGTAPLGVAGATLAAALAGARLSRGSGRPPTTA